MERLPHMIRGKELFKDCQPGEEGLKFSEGETILRERSGVFSEYGKNWALDIFCITHNAVRAEFQDLFAIVTSMAHRKESVSVKDIEEVFNWWPVFAQFLVEVLEMENTILFPRWEETIPLAGPVSSLKREDLRNRTKLALESVSIKKNTFKQEHPSEIFGQLVKFTESTVREIESLFMIAEVETVAFLLKQPKFERTGEGLFEFFAAYMHSLVNPNEFATLWMRGFRSTEPRNEFREVFQKLKKKKRFGNSKRIVEELEVTESRIQKSHYQVVREFWRNWREAEVFLSLSDDCIELPASPKEPKVAEVLNVEEEVNPEPIEEYKPQFTGSKFLSHRNKFENAGKD
ncbi:hypothetical protein NDN08_003943 [Rhodosorus marinus]|uniref:Uncharacterized protein n=1 Tax=Rhodosorus marinus TaxID=101924 RepID=A0AAV8UKE8_9RHOD|nr:hypothetical protein NDN08_003943 [Rhodosorus marinus]